MTTDETKLLTTLRERRPEAFQVLFEQYSDRLFRLGRGMCGSEQAAEDLVQETFLRFFEKVEQFEGRSSIGTWLYRTAHNACIDRIRKRKPTVNIAGDEYEDSDLPMPGVFVDWHAVPEKEFGRAEIQAELDAAVAALPETLRAVFILRDMDELSTAEVAQVLEISKGAVKVRLHRARLELRERLSSFLAEFEGASHEM